MKIFNTRRFQLTATGVVAGVLISLLAVGMNAPPCASASSPTCPTPAERDFSGKLGIQSNTPYTTTLSAAATTDQIITLPDADTSLVGATSTDTLENKTIDFTLNTGSNYAVGNLSGTTLSPLILNSSLTSTGVLSSFDIGSAGTTLTESVTYGAGDVEIEGNVIYRDDGVTIPIGDGGTGVETLTANGVVVNGASALTAVSLGTKGQLFVGDGSGLPQAFPVGADGDQLAADPAEVTGLKWVGAAGGGSTALQSWAYTNNYNAYIFTGLSWQDFAGQAGSNDWNYLGSSDGMDILGASMTAPPQYQAYWKFMETGQWMVRGRVKYVVNYNMVGGYIGELGIGISYTSDNAVTYTQNTYNVKEIYCSSYCYVTREVFFIVDVDDIATDYIKFQVHTEQTGPYPYLGNVSYWGSRFDFVRLGS